MGVTPGHLVRGLFLVLLSKDTPRGVLQKLKLNHWPEGSNNFF